MVRRSGQVVRQRSAKSLYAGSIPAYASLNVTRIRLGWWNGIHERLKISWSQDLVGSSPTPSTLINLTDF